MTGSKSAAAVSSSSGLSVAEYNLTLPTLKVAAADTFCALVAAVGPPLLRFKRELTAAAMECLHYSWCVLDVLPVWCVFYVIRCCVGTA